MYQQKKLIKGEDFFVNGGGELFFTLRFLLNKLGNTVGLNKVTKPARVPRMEATRKSDFIKEREQHAEAIQKKVESQQTERNMKRQELLSVGGNIINYTKKKTKSTKRRRPTKTRKSKK